MSTYEAARCDNCGKEEHRPVVNWVELGVLDTATYGGDVPVLPQHFCCWECAALGVLKHIPFQRVPYLFAVNFGDIQRDTP